MRAQLSSFDTFVKTAEQFGCIIGPSSLTLPKGLVFDDWKAIGLGIGRLEDQSAWSLGDWWTFGEHKYRRAAIVHSADWLGPPFQSCANRGRVSRAFAASRRREALSWSHHEAVVAQPREEQERLLDLCEQHCWSVHRLRDELRQRARPPIVAAVRYIETAPAEPLRIAATIAPQHETTVAPKPVEMSSAMRFVNAAATPIAQIEATVTPNLVERTPALRLINASAIVQGIAAEVAQGPPITLRDARRVLALLRLACKDAEEIERKAEDAAA